MNRAERRHRRQRKVAYAMRKLAQWHIAADKAPYWADNMAKCVCWMCNGEARHTKPEVKREDIHADNG